MAKRPTAKPPATYSWAVYHLRGTPAKLVGIVEAPDAETTMAKAARRNTRCRPTYATG
jgi:hypothetical protein